ncbi:hypothetical protein L1049_014732 [Liquidambar formosana]|uniref:non-specific serine/threonine protein kinase n=1 Tax=Liquidambar formosana TaxID=63359 RepID=A0AAP0S370_LIQFO
MEILLSFGEESETYFVALFHLHSSRSNRLGKILRNTSWVGEGEEFKSHLIWDKVYRGTLSTGELVAIKRAQQGSTQGGLEFKTGIELLSRVHHKNVVSLVGFCFDQGEQMLVYEYVPNGTLKDRLSGTSVHLIVVSTQYEL